MDNKNFVKEVTQFLNHTELGAHFSPAPIAFGVSSSGQEYVLLTVDESFTYLGKSFGVGRRVGLYSDWSMTLW